MKLLSAFLASFLGLALAHNDHGGQHIPKVLAGRKFLSELEAQRKSTLRDLPVAGRQNMAAKQQGSLKQRQDDDDDRCGPGFGSCASGDCCSYEGCVVLHFSYHSGIQLTCRNRWCGKGKDYCSAPDCQINYSTGCDAVCTLLRTMLHFY